MRVGRNSMNVLYIATSAYPGNSAYATRIEGLCKALMQKGHTATVLTDYSGSGIGTQHINDIRVISSAKHVYDKRNLSDKVLAASRMYLELVKLLSKEPFDCVIISSMYMRINLIIRILRKYSLPIILESCEWFDTYNWKRGKNSFEYKKYIRAWNKHFLKVDGVIAISRLLEDHYSEHGISSIRIPTIMDVNNTDYSLRNNNGKVRLVFTGSVAWGKDRISELIQALYELEESCFELHIYGPSEKDISSQLDDASILDKMRDTVFIHGKVPHNSIPAICSSADFGVFFRPNRRQSHAGFPTKLAEYMSSGTPVITNRTGDVDLYTTPEFLLKTEYSVEDIKVILKKIGGLSKEELSDLRKETREIALRNFDIQENSEKINHFLNRICCEVKNRRKNV